jgi:hypothetical protein
VTNEDTSANGTLVATDNEGSALTYSIVSQANANGTVQITNASTGAYSYTPATNYNGPASFTFKANDGALDSNIATVNITVNAVNDAPQASNGSLSTNEDVPTTGTLVANDVDGNPLTYSLVSTANAHGTVQITNATTGAYSYTPALDYNGPASFTFKASDGLLDSNIATVNITVNPVNDAPRASNGTLVTNEDTSANGTLVATDVDNVNLTYSLVSTANAHGTVQITNASTGAYSYTPALDYNGPASFTFKANDGLLDSNVATVNITVNPVNDAPAASNGSLSTNEDVPTTGTLVASDVDGNPLTYSLVSTANAHGTVQITNATTGAYSYTPALDYNGPASFTFKASDGLLDSNIATVNITVNPVNDAPRASDGSLTTNEDTSANGTLVATDVDNANLTYALVSTANAHGTVQITNASTGAYTYTPALDYNGPASFTFKANDGLLDSNIATVNITVNPVNDAPLASNGSLTTNEDVPTTGTLVATDVEGNPLTYSLLSIANAHGTVQITNATTGAYSYSPALDYNGPASFTFKASDGLLDSNIATVNITVNPVNDAPRASDGSLTTNEDTGANGTLAATDVDNANLTYALVSTANAHGTVQITNASTGAYSYTPALDYNGPASFTFKASDGLLDSNIATVNITINPVNDAPLASNGSLATNEDVPTTGNLVANDVDGNPLTYSLVSVANAHGTVQITNASTGAYSYTPAANYNGPASFTFKANDGTVDSNIATVNITVNAVNDRPTLEDDEYSIPENTPNTTPVGSVTGADIDGDTLAYSIVGGNTGGAFAIHPVTGVISVANSAALDYETTPVFNLIVRATDPGGLSADATVRILLTDQPDAPRRIGIDIRPGDSANTINIKSNGHIEVAILSTATFNAQNIDVNSLRFGRTGTEDSLSRNPHHGTPRYKVVDVNGDGRLDIVVTFEIEKTGFQVGDALGTLTGRTLGGEAFIATDLVTIRNPGR